MSAVLPRVQTLITQNPDVAYSRIMCPRMLADDTTYHAFLVPVFETGRLAGLGLKPDAAPTATHSAWETYPSKAAAGMYPYYYRWQFRTGSHGDFEYLVRLLQPQPVDNRVGTRDMDVQNPGSNLPGILDEKLHGILKLGGALRVPDEDLDADALAERKKYENWDQPYPAFLPKALAKFINLPDDYAAAEAGAANASTGLGPGIDDDPDPLITAPLYGQWHAFTQRLLTKRDGSPDPNPTNWVHKLNLDPIYRVPAHFGAEVVETNAEEYMNDAWQQIGDVLAANARIRRLLLAKEVSWRFHEVVLKPLLISNTERAFLFTAPVSRRVMGSPSTVFYLQGTSLMTPAYTSTAMRRVVRPGSRLMRSLPFGGSITPQNLLTRVNNGEVSAAPPKVVPPGVVTIDQVASAGVPSSAPAWVIDLLKRYPWLPLALLIVGVVIALLLFLLAPVVGIVPALVVLGVAIYLYRLLRNWQAAIQAAGALGEASQTPEAVAQYPANPSFVLTEPGSSQQFAPGTTDSPTAVNFKSALRDSFTLFEASRAVSVRPTPITLDLAALTEKMVVAVDPLVTIPRRGLSIINIPPWVRELIGDDFREIMAYPKIDVPMYGPLKCLSKELFLPNINFIAPNSITLIETNQKFIEAYMVGLNHEFARKLLWREYPTDQHGSYFRQFWDPRGFFDDGTLTPEQLKEKLYDMPALHKWRPDSQLGSHNNRIPPGTIAEQAVLVIRGELLKKYPTAVIYAHHAQWETTAGKIDPNKPRTLQDIDAAFEEKPPRSIVRTPLYEAKVDPDIYFFGFDLTIEEAKGGSGQNPSDDPGWFFVIKERPGEPRFGLELTRTDAPEVFDELIWADAIPEPSTGKFLPAGSLAPAALKEPKSDDPENKLPQYKDDSKVNGTAQSAARWAYLLYRAPVMVAVHADEMLRNR